MGGRGLTQGHTAREGESQGRPPRCGLAEAWGLGPGEVAPAAFEGPPSQAQSPGRRAPAFSGPAEPQELIITGRGDRGQSGGPALPGSCFAEIAKVSVSRGRGEGSAPARLAAPEGPSVRPPAMNPPEEGTRCPARGKCPVYLAVSSGTVRYAPPGLGPALEGNLGEEPRDTDR